jgi:hypothetical protein
MPLQVKRDGTDTVWSQENLEELARRIPLWRKDPILFCREAVGVTPSKQQEQMLRSISEFDPSAGKFGTSIRSGKGVGKSFGAVLVMLWFLVCFRDSLVHVTATKEKTIKTVIWGEAEKLIRNSAFLSAFLEWQATTIRVRGGPDQWQAFMNTAKTVEAIQGEHREHMLVICDESSGMQDMILDALINGMTEDHNLMMMISNPTLCHGFFYDSHNDNGDQWDRLHFSARDSELVSKAHIARLERKWGSTSPKIAIDVDGEFPEMSDFSLFSGAWFDTAAAKGTFGDGAEKEMGVDVARFGADFTSVAVRQGSDLTFLERWHGADITHSSGEVVHILAKDPDIKVLKVDEIGVGGGLLDLLYEMQDDGKIRADVEIGGVNVAESADDDDDFVMLRDQLWFELADRLRDGALGVSPEVDEELFSILRSECLPVEYAYKADGRRKVDSKDEMRKKIGSSPDLTDAVLIAFRDQEVGVITVG